MWRRLGSGLVAAGDVVMIPIDDAEDRQEAGAEFYTCVMSDETFDGARVGTDLRDGRPVYGDINERVFHLEGEWIAVRKSVLLAGVCGVVLFCGAWFLILLTRIADVMMGGG